LALAPPIFAAPIFDFWAVLYTAAGATVFWGKWGRTRLRPFLLATVMDYFFSGQKTLKLRQLIEFVIFLGFGVLVGVGLTEPQNVTQALAAGLGWTGLVASNKPS
jgi:hypothetical protein